MGKKKKTHSEYVSDVNAITSDIEVVGQYNGANTKIKHRCKICKHEWDVKPNSILTGKGCPECAKLKRAKSKTKTHEQYVEEVASINKNIEVVGHYVNSNAKIELKCKLCGNKWFARSVDILSGHGCPKCSYKLKTKTQKQYIDDVALVNPNIVVIDEYINSYTKIKHFCLKCGNEWMAEPRCILMGNNCPQCANSRKSHEQYVEELLVKNPNIEVIETYIGANTNIAHRCSICGCEWSARPSHLLHGLGCPSCQGTSGEQEVKRWLIDNNIEYELQKRFTDCRNIRMLPFDFYLPDFNICIEYDGAQHYKEVNHWGGQEYLLQRQHNDKIKNDYCNKNNIYLIRIRYDEDVYDVLNSALTPIVFNVAS